MTKFLLAAAALVAVPALAQTMPMASPPGPAMPGMMAMKVQTRADVVARTQKMFAMLDSNHDGVLDQAESAAAATRWDGPRHGGASDASAGRMAMDRNAMFDIIDADHNGAISRDEFARAPMHHGEGRGMHGRHMGMGKRGMARMWTMADANHDGRVTLAEATTLAAQHFDRMDTNHDGQLSPEERAAGRAQMRQMRGK